MSESEGVFDVIVVGAGVIGSSTAYHLIQNGAQKVLLLEKFSVLHTRGSSHGCSRITRRAYVEPYYVHMMDEAFTTWDHLQKKSGTELYIQTGILVFGEESDTDLQKVITSLETNKVTFELFPAKEANERYSNQLKLPSSYTCVLEKDGGILLPQKAVAAYQKLFLEAGGLLWDECPVTEIIPGEVVKLITRKGHIMGRKVVVTVGPWAKDFMKTLNVELPLQCRRSEVYYWKADNPEHYAAKNFPVFIHHGMIDGKQDYYYGLPIHEYPGLVKASLHGGPDIHPDERDTNPTPEYNNKISKFIKEHFKSLATQSSIYEVCIITDTPDTNPILDEHPLHKNIIIGAGMSGHGFKLSPVLGKILCELALAMKPSYDLSPFKLSRFN